MNPVNYVFVYIILNIIGLDRVATQSYDQYIANIERFDKTAPESVQEPRHEPYHETHAYLCTSTSCETESVFMKCVPTCNFFNKHGCIMEMRWRYPLGDSRSLLEYNGRCRKSFECKSLRECPELLNLLQTRAPNVFQVLSELNCGFEGKTPLVCCSSQPRPALSQTQGPITNNKRPDISAVDVTFHPRLELLLPKTCGVLRENDKITMGEAAGLYEFPWMALLGYETGVGIDFLCGGSLINRRYVLTAAHCLKTGKYKLVTVRLGEYDLSRNVDCEDTCLPPVQNMGIEEIIPHPQYSSNSLKRDIGLIRLSLDVVFNEGTIPVCLPIGRKEQSEELTGQKVTVTGWGRTEYGSKSSILLKVDIPVVSRRQCAEEYKAYNKDIDITQMCAGDGNGKDSCTGDSGGPLQSVTPRNGEAIYVQYGVVSYGPKNCGDAKLPGVYTKTAFFMKWILDTMRP